MITNMTQLENSTLPNINWLTVEEVAQYFRVGRMTVYRWINQERILPAVQIGRSFRIDEEDVKALMTKSGLK